MSSKPSDPKRALRNQSSELSQLKVVVTHLRDAWPTVLQRRCFLRRMAQSEALRTALQNTHAGHVFNAMHAAMSFDLVRAVGALILDDGRRTASLRRAVHALRKQAVIEQLRVQVYGIPVVASEGLQDGTALRSVHRAIIDAVFVPLPAQLKEIEKSVLHAPQVGIIEDIRNKAVAHAAVEHDGTDWRMWAVSGTQLTYGQLDEYIDACTAAVDKLIDLVLRTAFLFDDLPGINDRYVNEYIEALVIGLTEQKQARERQREENLRRTQALIEKVF